jgi:hypothetical protein
VANITPDELAVLFRVKHYGLGTWRPGRLVISNARDESFARANSTSIATLIDAGYLAVDSFGSVITGLAGEHELRRRDAPVSESRSTIGGRRFQVVTEGWRSEAEASHARRVVIDGLAALADSDPREFDAVFRAVSGGIENDSLATLVQAATGRPRSEEGRRVGVRIYGNWSPD